MPANAGPPFGGQVEDEEERPAVDTTPKQAEVQIASKLPPSGADGKEAAAKPGSSAGEMKPNNSHTSLLALGATSPPPTPDANTKRCERALLSRRKNDAREFAWERGGG